jgi:hypothetical protein
MKKFLTLSLVCLMVLAVATLAWGAELSSSIGGRFYGYFSSIDGDHGFNPAPGNDCWDTILAGTLKGENGSWARLSFIASTWEQTINAAFGIDNIADSNWSMHFDTHDTGTTNLGQQFMGDLFNDFKADPYFNTCDMPGSFGVKYISDTLEIRAEAKVYDGNGDTNNTNDGKEYIETYEDEDGNEQTRKAIYPDAYTEKFALGLVFKNDACKYYIGAKHVAGMDENLYILGLDTKVGDLGLKLDLWLDKDGLSDQGEFKKAFWSGGGHQTLQATLSYDRMTGQLMYSQPEEDLDDVIGLGLAYRTTPKLTVGAKYFMVDDDVADDGFYDVYGLYNLGAWDIKCGVSNAQFPFGQGGANNVGQDNNPGDGQAFESEDPFFYVGAHFEF